MAGIIKIAESIEVDDPEMKLGGASQKLVGGEYVPRQIILVPQTIW